MTRQDMSLANVTASSVSSSGTRVNGATKRKASTAATNVGTAKASVKIAAPSRVPNSSSSKVMGRPASPVKRPPNLDLSEHEPIKAYLRIRPTPEDATKQEEEPYIEILNETEVLMSAPRNTTAARARVYSSAVPTKYVFSKVFPGDASSKHDSQAGFYKETALPLIEELLQGQSGLIFTYGVTNSGKSYTVQGGNASNEAGVLPRSMDTIFNSIKGLESTSEIRPVGLTGVELAKPDLTAANGINPFSIPGLSKKLPSSSNAVTHYDHDLTKIKVDRNYRYSVWVSYVEVYNEKIFDLLDAAPPASSTSRPSTFGGGFSRSESFRGSNWALASLTNDTGPIYLQRKPLTLKNDVESGGKYVAGLQEIRVHSVAEAREILQRGQENRQVFGTMANRASSRSHGVFTVKIIREHAGEKDLSVAFSTSRLSIVDLAGSERLGNTSVTGDRLKEAGSINKSLMCLGQCLETLRKNQTRAATFVPMPSPVSSIGNSSINTAASKLLKRRPSIVPFRHSKLTELFQSFFTGEGRAVMIVNVNPFDTGFDENSHVMRFSAAAKEVQTIRTQNTTTNLSRFVHPSLRDLFNPSASPAPSPAAKAPVMLPSASSKAIIPPRKESLKEIPVRREATKKAVTPPPVKVAKPAEQEVTIIEEDDDEEDEEQSDSFVNHLMVKYEEVRHRLYESERQCALIEQRVREEMAEEMSRRLQEMESIFNSRIVQDSTMHDDFVNRKLDLFTSSSSARRADDEDESEEEDDDDDDDNDDDDDAEVEKSLAVAKMKAAKEDLDDSVVIMKTKRSSTKKTILSDSEEDEEDDDADEKPEADATMDITADSMEADVINVDHDETASAAEEEDDEEVEQEEEMSSEEEDEDDEEASDSDCSFDASIESIESLESSFEAAPKRTSRGRVSKAKADKAPPKRPIKSASRALPSKAAPIVRKSANGLPLMERSANISIDDSQRSSDSSLILAEKPTKSPKKRKLTAKRSGIDEEALMDELGYD